MIKPCKCVNAYQDKRYGKNKRVHNPCGGTAKIPGGYRCTVCGDRKSV